MLSIPPHTSHKIQPLDVSFFGPLKRAFNKECDKFMRASTYKKITPYDIASIFYGAYMSVATIEKGVSGFHSTGIFPVSSNTFKEEDFFPVQNQELICIDDPDDIESENQEQAENIILEETDEESNLVNASNTYEVGLLDVEPCSSKTVQKMPHKTFLRSLEKFSPILKLAAESSKRKGHSSILTGTSMTAVLEETVAKRKEKTLKKEQVERKSAAKVLGMSIKTETKAMKETAVTTQQKKMNKSVKKRGKRLFSFENSSEEEGIDVKKLCDDNDNETFLIQVIQTFNFVPYALNMEPTNCGTDDAFRG